MQIDFRSLARDRKILLILNGVFNPSGGMYEYARSWINFLKNNDWHVGISGSRLALGSYHEDISVFFFHTSANNCDKIYRDLALSGLVGGKKIKHIIDKLTQHINEYQPSIVHFLDISLYTNNILQALSSIFPHITFVCTIHDPKEHESNISLIVKLWKYSNNKKILDLAGKRTNIHIHVHDLRLIIGTPWAYIKRVVVIPHPPTPSIVERQRLRPHNPGWRGPVRIGFMGRIEPYKGLAVLQSAVEIMLNNSNVSARAFEIIIAGKGDFPATDWLKMAIKVHIHNGFVSEMEFHNIMANLDLLVLPYLTATQSGVGFMAVSYGVPILATDVGAINGTVVVDGENGIIVEPNDPTALATKLATLIQNPGRLSTLSERATNRAGKILK